MVSRVLHLVNAEDSAGSPTVPPIVTLLAKVESYQRMLTRGLVKNRADLAARLGTTRARITQLLALLRLHPAILDHVRQLPPGTPSRFVTERSLRPLTLLAPSEQLKAAVDVLPGFVAGPRERVA